MEDEDRSEVEEAAEEELGEVSATTEDLTKAHPPTSFLMAFTSISPKISLWSNAPIWHDSPNSTEVYTSRTRPRLAQLMRSSVPSTLSTSVSSPRKESSRGPTE